MNEAYEQAVRRLASAAEGWWQVTLIVGLLSVAAGALLGYQAGTTGCDPTFGCVSNDGAIAGVFIGGALGVLPALPLLGVTHVLRHLAALEQTRSGPAATATAPVIGSDADGA